MKINLGKVCKKDYIKKLQTEFLDKKWLDFFDKWWFVVDFDLVFLIYV